jgi:hypothetical protein
MFEAKVLPIGDLHRGLAATVPPATTTTTPPTTHRAATTPPTTHRATTDRATTDPPTTDPPTPDADVPSPVNITNQPTPDTAAPSPADTTARLASDEPPSQTAATDHRHLTDRPAIPGEDSLLGTPDTPDIPLPDLDKDDLDDEQLGWDEDPEWDEREMSWFDPTLVDPLPADLGSEALLDDLQATHRAIAASQAREAVLVTELAHRRATTAVTDLTGRQARGMEALTIGARAVGEEVAREFTLSPTTAQSFTDTCVGLCLDTPDTLDALMRGDLDWAKAREILQLVQKLVISQTDTNADLPEDERVDPEHLGKNLERRLLDKAPLETRSEVKSRGRRQMIAANPHAAESRHRRARTRRMVTFFPDDDSMAHLNTYLPADAGIRAKHALTRIAHHLRASRPTGDKRSLDQWRVEALVETLAHAADTLHTSTSTSTGTGTGSFQGSSSQGSSPGPQTADTAEASAAPEPGSAPEPRTAPEPDVATAWTGAPNSTDHADITDQDTDPGHDSTSGHDDRPGHDSGYLPDTDLDAPDPHSPGLDDVLTDEHWTTDDWEPAHQNPNNQPTTATNTPPSSPSDTTDRTSTSAATDSAFTANTGPYTDAAPATSPEHGSATAAGSGGGRSRRPDNQQATSPSPAGPARSTPSRASRSDPRVQITISASTLIGTDDNPAWLHGYGPIIASMARDIAATGTWRCAITDPTHGTLLGLGTGTYTPTYHPTQRLRRFLQSRDRVCRVPGCNTPAELCDIDHRTPWLQGGPTCECNTECLCKTHHKMKHECGFTLTPSTDPNDPPGTLIWTTPAGHGFPSYPPQLADPDPESSPGPGLNPHPPSDPPPPELSSTLNADSPDPDAHPPTSFDPQLEIPEKPSTESSSGRSGTGDNISGDLSAHRSATIGDRSASKESDECHACEQADAMIAEDHVSAANLTGNASLTGAGDRETSSAGTVSRTRHSPDHRSGDDDFSYDKPSDEATIDGWQSRLKSHIQRPLPSLPRDGDPPPF